MKILYKPSSLRQYKKLPRELQQEVQEKIALLQEYPTHTFFKTYTLHGPLQGSWSFSVHYVYRVVFEYNHTGDVELLAVGDQTIYR